MMVKICGITHADDALAAIDAGADLLGLNFYPKSPRYILPASAARLVGLIRKRSLTVRIVGVFVNAPVDEVRSLMLACDLDLAQLSGDEPPEDLAVLDGRLYKALRLRHPADLALALQRYPAQKVPPAFLVDACRPGEYGGTGQLADWSLACSLASTCPILLAGGLSPQNVALAVRQVRPWGVDVASGVESSPGRKDFVLMSSFITLAKEAFAS